MSDRDDDITTAAAHLSIHSLLHTVSVSGMQRLGSVGEETCARNALREGIIATSRGKGEEMS